MEHYVVNSTRFCLQSVLIFQCYTNQMRYQTLIWIFSVVLSGAEEGYISSPEGAKMAAKVHLVHLMYVLSGPCDRLHAVVISPKPHVPCGCSWDHYTELSSPMPHLAQVHTATYRRLGYLPQGLFIAPAAAASSEAGTTTAAGRLCSMKQ